MGNVLEKTKCYLMGAVENFSGDDWRVKIENALKDTGIIFFNPRRSIFIGDNAESETVLSKFKSLRSCSKFGDICQIMKNIRSRDLRLCDLSDFGIAQILPNTPTYGTIEEISWFVRCKKPLFIFIEGGKEKCPLWILGMVPHEQVYNSLDEIIDKIKKIDAGLVKLDLTRWRLLGKEYR